jgi:hypothetical protein
MDPLDASARWNAWTVTGTGEQIDHFYAHLDAHLPAGWRRLTQAEEEGVRQTFDPRSVRWYAFSSPTLTGPTVGLTQSPGRSVRGGRVGIGWPVLPPPAEVVNTAWAEVMTFFDHGIGPAAHAAGVEFRAPTLEELFLQTLPIDTRDCLQQFSDAARKRLPLDAREAEQWRGFVVSAYRMGALFDSRQFVGWLVTQGWGDVAATELDRKLIQDVQLLELYRGEEFGR